MLQLVVAVYKVNYIFSSHDSYSTDCTATKHNTFLESNTVAFVFSVVIIPISFHFFFLVHLFTEDAHK